MKYAKLIKLGGELIAATDADYSDYKGFLRCPECGEVVFLRKQHQRGNVLVPDAFVHHRAIPEVSTCELRVGQYSPEQIATRNAISQGQRLKTLKLSLWKYLKTNIAVSFKQWSHLVKEAEKYEFISLLVKYTEDTLTHNPEYLLSPGSVLEIVADNVLNVRNLNVHDDGKVLSNFIATRSRDWRLHVKIAREAMELLISPLMAEVLHRLACCIGQPALIEACQPTLLDMDMSELTWREAYANYVLFQTSLVVLTVDWIAIWKD